MQADSLINPIVAAAGSAGLTVYLDGTEFTDSSTIMMALASAGMTYLSQMLQPTLTNVLAPVNDSTAKSSSQVLVDLSGIIGYVTLAYLLRGTQYGFSTGSVVGDAIRGSPILLSGYVHAPFAKFFGLNPY
jgi:hypothetical protein